MTLEPMRYELLLRPGLMSTKCGSRISSPPPRGAPQEFSRGLNIRDMSSIADGMVTLGPIVAAQHVVFTRRQ